MPRIDKLTPQQEALLPVVRVEWLAHGLSTEPADRVTAEAGVRSAYAAAGLTPPSIVVWLDSPFGGAIGTTFLQDILKRLPTKGQVRDQVRGQVPGQVWDQVWGQVRGQVGYEVGDQVGDQVWDQVGDQVRDQVRSQVPGQVWDQVWGQVGDQVWGQVRGQVRGQVLDALNYRLNGQHGAGYYAFYDTFARCGLADIIAPLQGQMQVARSAGWWWPLRGAVVLTDRPETLHRDAQGRLHNEHGPAIRYRDGWAVHAVHGVRLPGWVIDQPHKITPQLIIDERNAEVRRVMAEKYGWDRFLGDAGVTPIDVQPDPANPGFNLRLFALPDRIMPMGGARLLIVRNASVERDGTRRTYAITVDASHSDAVAAAASTFGLDGNAYRQLQRAT